MLETVTNNVDAKQFEIAVGGERAGLLRYIDHHPGAGDGRTERVMFHTEVAEEFGGRGLARALVVQALEQTRAEGLAVVAVCPYVKKITSASPEYDDLVVPTTDDALSAIRRDA